MVDFFVQVVYNKKVVGRYFLGTSIRVGKTLFYKGK